MSKEIIYPREEWKSVTPDEAGINPEKLKKAKNWLDTTARGRRYRVVIVKNGCLVAEWNCMVERNEKLHLASAAKAIFSNILGIAVTEGKIPSADAKVADYYPELMEVKEDEGPKPGRYAFEKDRNITFRQLISQTSGYMKPGEEPGKVFNQQTFGMNVLTHAIAKIYGLYDVNDPLGSPGLRKLIDEKIGKPLGVTWEYIVTNFHLHRKAKINIYGYYDGVGSNALDLARLGWLWRNLGQWEGKQIIPEAWFREATKTAPDIRNNCPNENWKYGYAFWTNDYGLLWPDLPRDSYMAKGNHGIILWVCPSLDLVVVESPGLYINLQTMQKDDVDLYRLLDMVTRAC